MFIPLFILLFSWLSTLHSNSIEADFVEIIEEQALFIYEAI